MIEFSSSLKPYSVKNECGDFYEYMELEHYYLLAVADIGGHGSHRVYTIANEIKTLINKCKNENIKDIITILHDAQIIKSNGMTLFIAHIQKNAPIMSYCAIGNTKSFIYRNKNFLNLKTQEGIIGYNIPRTIHTHIVKLLKNDILVSTTDGVSLHNSEISSLFSRTKDPKEIADYLVNECNNQDDSLSTVLKFSIKNEKNFSTKYQGDEQEYQNVQDLTVTTQHIKSTTYDKRNIKKKNLTTTNNKITHVNSNLILFTEENLLIKQIEKNKISFMVDTIAEQSQMELPQKIKLKTFLLECASTSTIDIYLKESILQVVVDTINDFNDTLEFLFRNYTVNKNKCIINITLPHQIKLTDELFEELQQRILLQLNETDYLKFKENERNQDKIASQTRLAAMGEMIGNIAHQWRQPLSVISTSATGLMMQSEYGMLTDEKLQQSCENINTNAQYLSKTIDDFRDFIKGENTEEEFSTNDIVEKSFTIIDSSIKDNYIDLQINNSSNCENLFGALNLLVQTIVNIINNAKDILIEKNIEDRIIKLDISDDNKNIFISITDNGGGIPKDIKPHIFDAYFTTKHQSKGTGLGLNMAYNIIHNSFDGSLHAENITFLDNDKEHSGAMFKIKIPIKQSPMLN